MTKSGPLGLALARSLRDAQLLPRDAAGVQLVKRYATLLDDAQALADEADLIEPETESQARRLAALKAKVDAQTVASDLGPKLLAALTALGMTVAGRATTTKEKSRVAVPGAAKLDELRARRASRAHGTASVDASTP